VEQPKPVKRLIKALSNLPGIGEKTATRLALYLLRSPQDISLELADSIKEVKEKIRLCKKCFNYTEKELCEICLSPYRDSQTICVVESPADLMALEKTGKYKGKYHVLHGLISPLEGISPDDLRINELLERIRTENIKEVIIATNATIAGGTTTHYLAQLIKPLGIKVTQLAQGIPTGADIEYIDEITLSNALEGRRQL